MFKIETFKSLSLRGVIYILVFILVSFTVYATGIKLQTLISVEGAVIGYTYVVIVPIWIHLKCVWYDKTSGTVEGDEERNSQVKPNECECENHYRSKWTLYLETGLLVFALVFGFALMCVTLASVI